MSACRQIITIHRHVLLMCLCVVFGPVAAVGDIHGVDTLNYSKDEKVTRGKIAACYRLADINGWSHGLDGYITVRQLLANMYEALNPLFVLNVITVTVTSSCDVCHMV